MAHLKSKSTREKNKNFVVIYFCLFDHRRDKNIQLNVYKLIRADHLLSIKKHWLFVLLTHETSMNAFVCEVITQNSKGHIGVIYRSPSQDFEFENFISNFDKILNNTTPSNGFFNIILVGLNARSSVWWTKIKQQLKAHNLNSLKLYMGFILNSSVSNLH